MYPIIEFFCKNVLIFYTFGDVGIDSSKMTYCRSKENPKQSQQKEMGIFTLVMNPLLRFQYNNHITNINQVFPNKRKPLQYPNSTFLPNLY
jgi:hypothetical protein